MGCSKVEKAFYESNKNEIEPKKDCSCRDSNLTVIQTQNTVFEKKLHHYIYLHAKITQHEMFWAAHIIAPLAFEEVILRWFNLEFKMRTKDTPAKMIETSQYEDTAHPCVQSIECPALIDRVRR